MALILDGVTSTVNFAFHIYKLRTAYSGYCVKVKRTSDSTEQDIGFVNNQLDWHSAMIFAEGSTLKVTTFYDQSGNGNHKYSVSGAEPTLDLGERAFRFNSSEVALGDLSALTSGEVFFPFKNDLEANLANGDNRWWVFGSAGDGQHLAYWSDGIIYEPFGTTVRKTTVNPTPALTNWNVYNVYSVTNDWRNALNGDELYITTTNTVGFSSAAKLGKDTSSAYAQGYSRGLILFSQKVTTDERTLLSNQVNYVPSLSTGVLDTHTAKVAYGLRKLKSTYSGSAVRVRRSTDDAEQDIGFDSSGQLDWSAAETFAGAGNLFVKTWYDQSGNANNLTQTTSASQPKLSLDTRKVEFDGTSDYLLTDATVDLSATDKLSFYSRLKRLSVTGNYEKFIVGHIDATFQLYYDISFNDISSYIKNAVVTHNTSGTSLGVSRLYTIIADTALSVNDVRLFTDSLSLDSETGSTSGNFANQKIAVGVGENLSSFFANFALDGFVLFATAHDTTTRQSIESDIAGGLGAVNSTTPLSVEFTGAGTSINSGQNITLTPSVSGGSGTKTYEWKLDGSVFSTSSSPVTITAPSAGSHTVRLTVTDDSGTEYIEHTFFVGTITGASDIDTGETSAYTTNVTSPVWSIESGGGSIDSSGNLTAPGSGSGTIVIKATKTGDSTVFATASVNYAPPPPALVAGFSIPATLQATDTLVITDESSGTGRTYEWTVNTDPTVRSTAAEPNLTQYLVMGTNNIHQKVIQGLNEETATETVIVEPKVINVGNVTSYNLTGLSSGLSVKAKVRAVDIYGNPSDYSNEDTATTT